MRRRSAKGTSASTVTKSESSGWGSTPASRMGLSPAVWGNAARWAFANAHRAALPHTAGESPIREAGVDPQPEDSLFVTVLALVPLALLLLIAIYVRSHWDQIPDRVPVHFGFRGPDRWV